MTHGTRRPLRFSRRRGRRVEANFQGGSITGNGGVMLVSEQDRRLGPGARIARLLGDPRHSRLNLLRQRLHALCLGHEDPDDHDELRPDAALQSAADRDTAPGNADGAQQAGAIGCLPVRRLRQQWPGVRIILRGDSGCCRRRIPGWCERHGVKYLTGIACNSRITEQQLDLFADRTSCSLWWPNQYRMLLSGLAYVLLEQIRRNVLYGTRLARAHVGTLRLKLLRIGAVIVRNTRRVVFMLSGSCPYQDLFRLAPG